MSALFTPLELGSLTIPNRIGMSPMTRNRSSASRAAGGAGLIVSEDTLVTQQRSAWPDAPGIWNKAQAAGWKRITDAVHAHGSKMYCQISHPGRCAHPETPEQIAAGVPVYAPSAIAARGGKFYYFPGTPGYVTPTEIPDPAIIIAQFKEAAVNAKEAGFDGVELHAAGGYLVHEFLDSSSNKRIDKWGGSVENHTRFALEILKALREVFGRDVALKVSPNMGMPRQETIATFGHLLREVNKLNIAYVAFLRYMEIQKEFNT
ncbi:hypothetical protein DFH07DRAFT_1033348 [Mycena maculata]|uniref:NADH:flavin oxidoreductase/NADH oxidase N-terminal domain-containing protein n=1 Tax=Mycena maculata TaxID=230809 RepID=A0AAD7K7D3_9AGAR|nr:hypothetical protein DFH07DRAFT_1033348 [Mycena maculata]